MINLVLIGIVIPFVFGILEMFFRRFCMEDLYGMPNRFTIGYILAHLVLFLIPIVNYILVGYDIIDAVVSNELYLRDSKFVDWLNREI